MKRTGLPAYDLVLRLATRLDTSDRRALREEMDVLFERLPR